MGVAYNPACNMTSQIWDKSRKRTKRVAKIKAKPLAMRNNSTNNGRSHKAEMVKRTPLASAKIKTTIRLIEKLMAAPATAEMTTICLEKFSLRSKSPRVTIETMPIEVASEKKDQITLAKRRATAKWGTFPPKRRNLIKTKYIIVNIRRGFKIDQR